ncbi:CopM family metallochaperone [Nostoc sp.]|uniref:CopM family metallochaperone n=1 Tax=Nostoc sp. TaxID=1180 RepID=UPI002FF9A305
MSFLNSAPFLLSLSIGIPVASMMPNHHTPANEAFGKAMTSMHTAMERVQMTGNTDTDFAAMMIPHHQGAIEMAKTELQYGTDPRLRRLAQEIIVTQQSEIELMQLTLKHPQSPAPSAK